MFITQSLYIQIGRQLDTYFHALHKRGYLVCTLFRILPDDTLYRSH